MRWPWQRRTQAPPAVEERSDTWPSTSLVWPSPVAGLFSAAGVPVTMDTAYGVPAVASVIRQPASLIASMPFITYRRGDTRSKAENTLQWQLLHDQPNPETDTFQFFYDIAISLEATQNAFVQKAKYRDKLYALIVLDPQRMLVTVNRDGTRRYEYYLEGGERVVIPPDQVLHIRGWTPCPGSAMGVSYISAHRDPIGAAIAMQKFEGDFFRNSAQSPFVFTGAANQGQAKELMTLWNSEHAGSGNHWKIGALWGNIGVQQIPISMEDAAFIEAKKLSVEDACRMWHWPHHLAELSGSAPLRNEDMWTALFLKMYVFWRMKRIERAFAADPDIYAGTDLYGEFDPSAVERSDFSTRMTAYKNAVQGGIYTPNECRERENLPPVPGGDDIQFPLVGGGPVAGGASDEADTGSPAGNDAQPRSNGHKPAETVEMLDHMLRIRN